MSRSRRSGTVLFSCLALALGASGQVGRAEGEQSGSQSAQAVVAVTRENLLSSDRFWPSRVQLVEPWQADPHARLLRAGTAGILIRVEDRDRARVDFGRYGVYEVPIAATDLIERANQVRLGELAKAGPNFLNAIGPRLVDSAADTMQAFKYAKEFERPGFLCVFADPRSDDFAALASALAPLAARYDLLPLVFPQGRIPDREVGTRLRSLDWKVPFVFDHLSEAYTTSLLSEPISQPIVLLQTREGRVLFRGTWNVKLAPELAAALDRTFGPPAENPPHAHGVARMSSFRR